jgi:hypothetical protein
MTGTNSTYHARWVLTTALIYHTLELTKANQEHYELVQAAGRPGDANRDDVGNGGSVVRVNAEAEESCIDFVVRGEHPHSLSPTSEEYNDIQDSPPGSIF